MGNSGKSGYVKHFNRAQAYLLAKGWKPVVTVDGELMHSNFEGDNGRWEVLVQAREAEGQLIVYSLCPYEIPEYRRPAIMEFITRANFGLVTGNFELNLEDGDLRYKTSVDSNRETLTQAVLDSLLYANMAMFDQYLLGIAGVLAGKSVQQCIYECELGMKPVDSEEDTDGRS